MLYRVQISLFAFHMCFLFSPRAVVRALHHHPRAALIVSGVIGSIWTLLGSANGAVLLGNYLTVQGSYPETLPGNPPAVLPTLVWQALSLLSLLSLLAFVGTGLTLHTLPRGSGTTVTRSTAQSSGVHLSWVFCLMMLGEVAAVKIATPESLLIDTSFRLSRSS
jgi:hypothetical protein